MSKRDADTAQLDSKATQVELAPEVLQQLTQLYQTTPVQDGDLKDSTFIMLSEFDVETQVKILQEYGTANFDKIRNKDGYLKGTIRKRRKISGPKKEFAYAVQREIDRMYDSKILKVGQLDDRCWDALRTLDEETAVKALARFVDQKREKEEIEGDIRNLSAFFMAQIKFVEREFRTPRPTNQLGNMYTQVYGGGLGLTPLTTLTATPQGFTLGATPLGATALGATPLGAATLGAATLGATPVLLPNNNLLNLTYYGLEQAQMGVRVLEFHNLSEYAAYVHPAAALKLQQLWDAGINVLSEMNSQSWEALAMLNGDDAVVILEDTGQMLKSGELRNLNGYFLSKARPRARQGGLGGSRMMGMRPMGTPQSANGIRGRRDRGDRGDREPQRNRRKQTNRQDNKNQSIVAGQEEKLNSFNQQSYLKQQPQIVGLEQKPKGKGDLSILSMLSESVKGRVMSFIQSHPEISEDSINVGVVQALKALPEEKALQVVNQLEERDLSNVQNISGYITGICRTVMSKN
eukprot:TRINITY_DN539_c0_g2_i1.p1 TRINITY_DN539_c0_g2~~TRINITY_DN539_c0_g2_i1.p1  ORF type:complete len:520 (+),score=85.72 TRINITY_DN539_c0_g2_i1:290-1849(+)